MVFLVPPGQNNRKFCAILNKTASPRKMFFWMHGGFSGFFKRLGGGNPFKTFLGKISPIGPEAKKGPLKISKTPKKPKPSSPPQGAFFFFVCSATSSGNRLGCGGGVSPKSSTTNLLKVGRFGARLKRGSPPGWFIWFFKITPGLPFFKGLFFPGGTFSFFGCFCPWQRGF